jgi:hypothetical protein
MIHQVRSNKVRETAVWIIEKLYQYCSDLAGRMLEGRLIMLDASSPVDLGSVRMMLGTWNQCEYWNTLTSATVVGTMLNNACD